MKMSKCEPEKAPGEDEDAPDSFDFLRGPEDLDSIYHLDEPDDSEEA